MKIKKKLAGLFLAGLVTATTSIQAKEGGDQYPNGAEGFMVGALPPTGSYFLNYAGNYNAELRDDNGDEIPGVEVNATFNALRVVHVTDKKLFGADYGVAAILPLVNLKFDTPGGDTSTTGIGDITLTPIILGWHTPNLHWVAAFDILVPSGKYSKDDPRKRIGANYWGFEPVFAVTYLNENGWEASSKFMYNMMLENNHTNYQSGDEFHMDFMFAKHTGPWAVGIGGYYLKQLEDDELNGVKLPNRRGQVTALGPHVKYDSKYGSLIFKYYKEFNAENRFEGDKFFFKFITKF